MNRKPKVEDRNPKIDDKNSNLRTKIPKLRTEIPKSRTEIPKLRNTILFFLKTFPKHVQNSKVFLDIYPEKCQNIYPYT